MRTHLPTRRSMIRAFLASDSAYDDLFVTAVRSTGIFCRPSCRAKKPRLDNVEFFGQARDALFSGYRPCKRCLPLLPAGTPPTWLEELLRSVEADPSRRWTDAHLRGLGLNPDRIRRWFQGQHGMTFQGYTRARRLGLALRRIQMGEKVLSAAYDHGYESLSGFNEAFRRLTGTSPKKAGSLQVVAVQRIVTPLGPMIAGATDEALCFLEFADRRMLEVQVRRLRGLLRCQIVPGDNPILRRTVKELDRYFSGDLKSFTVPLLAPGSPHQKEIWERLRRIPAGATVTYGELAAEVGCKGAARAVGRSVGDNRIAIIIPCHRVVGSKGLLTGYGGGLWRKRRLLELEGVLAPVSASKRSAPDRKTG